MPGPEPYYRFVPVLSARHEPIESQEVQLGHAKDWMESLIVYTPAHKVPKLQLAPRIEVTFGEILSLAFVWLRSEFTLHRSSDR